MLSSDQMNAKKSPKEQIEYLYAMGIQTWVRRGDTATIGQQDENRAEQLVSEDIGLRTDHVSTDQNQLLAPVIDSSHLDWPQLQAAVTNCTACMLHESRTQTVFGVGDHQAQVMVIGEAPGADEDQQGEPFVGRAGKLLNNMLLAIGYKREQVYIANILKCRPPDNRDPRPEEIAQCEHFLKRQVELIQPKIIIAVGRIAAHNLMKVETPIGKMRGRLHHYGETPVVVTYHPAYLLRKPGEKAKAWDDLRFAMKIINDKES